MGLIQAAEIWLPDAEGQLLEFGGGLYGDAVEFGLVSRSMCFGRGEGLPGRVWDEARPILLKDLQGGYFRRAAAARAANLVCALALPSYFGAALKAVVVLFCGGDMPHAGAVELWHNDPRVTTDLKLHDGFYGATPQPFASVSEETYLPRGVGLPGLAWQRGRSVWLDGLASSPKFLRSEAAGAAGIERGLALPCPVPGRDHYIATLLASAGAPIAARIEAWGPDPAGAALQRIWGQCERGGVLPAGADARTSGVGGDTISAAFASALPRIAQRACDEPGAVGAAAAAAGLGGLIALPVVDDGAVVETVVLYF